MSQTDVGRNALRENGKPPARHLEQTEPYQDHPSHEDSGVLMIQQRCTHKGDSHPERDEYGAQAGQEQEGSSQ